jgi:hypothetical protein
MTRYDFVEYLIYEEIKIGFFPSNTTSNMLVITHEGDVHLGSEVDEIPSGVEFRNTGHVRGSWVKIVNPNVIFNNQGKSGSKGTVWLPDADKIYPGVEFRNNGSCILKAMEPSGKTDFQTYGSYWKGNIRGINSHRLLNVMINNGLFI